MTWLIGSWGMHERGVLEENAAHSRVGCHGICRWVLSFVRSSIRWRNVDYRIREGRWFRLRHKSKRSIPSGDRPKAISTIYR